MTESKDLIIIAASCGKNLELSQKFLEKSSELKISSEILDLTTIDIPLFNPRIHSKENIPNEIEELKKKLFKIERWVICAPEYNGSIPPILSNFIAWLDASVKERMECGDHWVIYAEVLHGNILKSDSLTAVHHRKTGANY